MLFHGNNGYENAPLCYADTYIAFNPLNTELNPICHLLALLGSHPILHVSRIRVKPSNKILFAIFEHYL